MVMMTGRRRMQLSVQLHKWIYWLMSRKMNTNSFVRPLFISIFRYTPCHTLTIVETSAQPKPIQTNLLVKIYAHTNSTSFTEA